MADLVLVVAPHPDDESIGCGGQILRHRLAGDRVQVVFLTSGERGIPGMAAEQIWTIREAEAHRAAEVLDVEDLFFLHLPDGGLHRVVEEGARRLAAVLETNFPQILYLPHPADHHSDHLATLPLVRDGLQVMSEPEHWPLVRGYEVWTPMEKWSRVEDVTPFMARKLQAVRCYPSQLQFFRYDRAVRGLNRYRGIMAGQCRFGEAIKDVPLAAGNQRPAMNQELVNSVR
jgi:N-acetylglucosamine malate deacetylase 1